MSQHVSVDTTDPESRSVEQNALDVGERVPQFELQGVHRGEFARYSLEDLTDDGWVLLGVYAFDLSPVCTRQMCQLTDMDWYEYKNDLDLLGINREGPYSHREFAAQEDIGFPLLCDTDGRVCESLGVLQAEAEGCLEIPRRSLFLVDEDRTVQYRWLATNNWEEDDSNFGTNPVEEAIETL